MKMRELAPAIENAIFRNFMECGRRIFTPEMFSSDVTCTYAEALSVLVALTTSGCLRSHAALRDPVSNEIVARGTPDEVRSALTENASLAEARLALAFEVTDTYIAMRLQKKN
jgi:hypothetical protein